MKYLDIHTHVNIEDEDVISIRNLIPGDCLPDSPFSIGLHPWIIEEKHIEDMLSSIKSASQNKNCFAIGECGLDRPNFIKTGRGEKDRDDALKKGTELQTEVFIKQIEIANFAKKPLIIHCVRALPELLHIHKTEKPETPWIIHGFRGSPEEATSLINKGIYLSFGKTILYDIPSNKKIRKIFFEIPKDMIFLETDNVDSAERNIKDVYSSAAKIRGVSLEDFQHIIIEKNYLKVFN